VTLFCRGLRRQFSADPHCRRGWPFLHVPVPQHYGALAAVPQPADLGRVCVRPTSTGFAAFLVRGLIPGLARSATGSVKNPVKIIYACCRWVGEVPRVMASVTRLYLLLAVSRRRWFSPCNHGREFRLSRIAIVPGWDSTIFRRISWPGLYSGFAMVLTIRDSAAQAYGLEDFITCATGDMAKSCWNWAHRRITAIFFEFFMSLYSGNKLTSPGQQRLHGGIGRGRAVCSRGSYNKKRRT